MPTRYVGLGTLARALGCSKQTLRRAIVAGKLVGARQPGRTNPWRAELQSVRAYLESLYAGQPTPCAARVLASIERRASPLRPARGGL
jgi:hypothetical protein